VRAEYQTCWPPLITESLPILELGHGLRTKARRRGAREALVNITVQPELEVTSGLAGRAVRWWHHRIRISVLQSWTARCG